MCPSQTPGPNCCQLQIGLVYGQSALVACINTTVYIAAISIKWPNHSDPYGGVTALRQFKPPYCCLSMRMYCLQCGLVVLCVCGERVHICACVCMYECMYVLVCVCVYVCVCSECVCVVSVCIYVHVCACMSACTCLCVYVLVYWLWL